MNPILLSAAFGLFKGATMAKHEREPSFVLDMAGPFFEETIYRGLPLYTFGDRVPRGLTALHFAADHVLVEHQRFGLNGAAAAARFADVFAGGLLYEMAFRRWGIFGAFVAHAAHNFMCGFGAKVRRSPFASPSMRVRRG